MHRKGCAKPLAKAGKACRQGVAEGLRENGVAPDAQGARRAERKALSDDRGGGLLSGKRSTGLADYVESLGLSGESCV